MMLPYRRVIWGLICLASLAAAPSLAPQARSSRLSSVSIDASISTYRILGDSHQEVRRALRTLGPYDSNLKSRDAYTSWSLRWHWGKIRHGTVEPHQVAIQLKTEIIVPRLQTDSEELQKDWSKFFAPLLRHELTHQKFAIDGALRLRERLSATSAKNGALPLGEAEEIAAQIVAEIQKSDHEYDLSTNHGETEGVRW